VLICLAYHKVLDRLDGERHTVTTATFAKHLALIEHSDTAAVDPHALRPGGEAPRGVLATFDDATHDHHATVKPLLARFGMRALFYVPTARLGEPGHATHEQVKDLAHEGHVIGSHSHTHPRLTEMAPEPIAAELERSAQVIHDLLGERPLHFAPPGGLYDGAVQRLAHAAGYRFFRTMRWGYNRRFEPMRIEVIPMTERWGELFLRHALADDLEWGLKLAYRLKQSVRATEAQGKLRQQLRRATANR
jgi:peptidoglycan/xylan/chitin deacetylase (PgdA/CDA1 family)